MWGNRQGWLISAAIAVVMLGLMGVLQWSGTAPSGMTARFEQDKGSLQPIALPVSPESIVAMPDDCDAAQAYGEALAEYQANEGKYKAVNSQNVEQLPALEKIVAGAKCKRMTLFSKDPSKVVNFERVKRPVEDLRQLGELTANKGLLLAAKKDYDRARTYGEAAFALGAKMYNERVVYEEYDAGMGVMGAAAGALIKAAHDDNQVAREQELKDFEKARIAMGAKGARVADLRAITHNIDGNLSATRAGDVFALAANSQERMWRVEACLQLARIHRYVGDDGRAADQRYAQILLKRLTNDPDPIVKYAADRALNITELEYNKQ